MKLVQIDETIFREYDIRGIYDVEINANVAYTIGRSFASYIEDKQVIIGHDNRSSSPLLSECLIKGLIEGGANVIDLGLVTTPMYYFAKKSTKVKSGIMITASHNPKEYNGFKISFSLEGNAYGKYIYDFRDYTNKLNFTSGNGSITKLDIRENYLELIKNSIDIKKRLKVVVDCGNGTGSIIIKDILDMFDIEYKLLYCESNSDFPNHQPDPAVYSNQIDLSNKVKELGYDLGIGIDGDADRVGIVDNKGNILASDIYLAIMYRFLSPTMKNKKAIYDVKCSKSLIDELKRLNLEATMYRTGNSYMNMKINSENYEFGGEFSGHVWFNDKFPGFDDGIYAGLRMIELLSKTDETLFEIYDSLNKYYATEELKVKVDETNKFNIVNEVKNYCLNKKYHFNDIDGVRVIFEDSWGLVRASNTGPNIILRFEAKEKKRLEEIKLEFTNVLNKLIQK